ncbi:MAG: cation transporter [Myxococcales bacterium]|nr:cation transporter [Myxococcales bacterium]
MADDTARQTEKTLRLATIGGAVLSALAASVCCIGPLVVAALGVGGAGLMHKFAPYRPYLMVLTVVCLGVGFFLAYRRGAQDDCGCDARPRRRRRRIGIWVATVAVAALSAAPYLVGGGRNAPALAAASAGANARTVTLAIQGMTCGGCAATVRKALGRLRGVVSVSVSYKQRRAVIRYRPDAVRVQALVKAIEKLGYKVTSRS